MEQHPSYPLGNPYWIHHTPATLQPAGSSQPKLDPRLAMRLAMHMDTHAPEDALSSVARGSAHAQAALEERDDEGPLPYSVGADGHVTLAPHLRLKAQMGASPAPPAWPFPRYGPGPSARPHAALFRRPAGTEPDESVWADLALEALVPRARPDSYSLPSTLMHTYAKDAQGRRRRERPSGMPSTLGASARGSTRRGPTTTWTPRGSASCTTGPPRTCSRRASVCGRGAFPRYGCRSSTTSTACCSRCSSPRRARAPRARGPSACGSRRRRLRMGGGSGAPSRCRSSSRRRRRSTAGCGARAALVRRRRPRRSGPKPRHRRMLTKPPREDGARRRRPFRRIHDGGPPRERWRQGD